MNTHKTKSEIIAFLAGLSYSVVTRFVVSFCRPNCPDGNVFVIWLVLAFLILVVVGGALLFIFPWLKDLDKIVPSHLAGFGIGAGIYTIITILAEL